MDGPSRVAAENLLLVAYGLATARSARWENSDGGWGLAGSDRWMEADWWSRLAQQLPAQPPAQPKTSSRIGQKSLEFPVPAVPVDGRPRFCMVGNPTAEHCYRGGLLQLSKMCQISVFKDMYYFGIFCYAEIRLL